MPDDPSARQGSTGTPVDRGLRLRMAGEARRVHSQHEQLAALIHELREVLGRPDPRASRRAFDQFSDALDAHMRVEETVYFPALHGLVPEVDAELSTLIAEHRVLRDVIDEIAEAFEVADAEGVKAALSAIDAFADRSKHHEEAEERLIDRVRTAADRD